VSFKMGASGTSKCTAYIRWEWRPVSVANSTGRSTSLALPTSGFDHLEVAATNDGQRTACYFNGSSGLQGLAPGDWEISLAISPAGTVALCQVTLKAGSNSTGFRQGSSTCKQST